MTRTLARDHDDLRAAMHDYAAILRGPAAEGLAAIMPRRIRFSQIFREHMGREDGEVEALANRLRDPAAMKVVRDHRRALVALFLRYSDHVKQWTPAEIARDWAGYRDGVLALQEGLHDRMAWEEAELHPLIVATGHRAAPSGPIAP